MPANVIRRNMSEHIGLCYAEFIGAYAEPSGILRMTKITILSFKIKWLGDKDSNLDRQSQSLQAYR